MLPISSMREPMAEPNTTKYNAVASTGAARLCINVRAERAISKRKMA